MVDGKQGATSIAFVILSWNSESYLGQCLSSVLGLGCMCRKALVYDNGSADGSWELVRGFAREDARVLAIRAQRNMGTTISRNTLLQLVPADATHVCVLDSDTVVNAAAFEEMAFHLGRHPDVGVVGPTLVGLDGRPQLSGRALPTPALKLGKVCPVTPVRRRAEAAEAPTAPVVDGLQDVGYLISACWLVPRSTFDRVGLLDEGIFYAPEDAEWCARVHEVGLRVCLCPGAEITHAYQRLSRRRLLSASNARHVAGLARFFRAHRAAIGEWGPGK